MNKIFKTGIGLIAAVLISFPSNIVSAGGIEEDKIAHIGASAAVDYAVQASIGKNWTPFERWLFTTGAIGGGKELYDSQHPGRHASWGDIAADAVGAAIAETLPLKKRGKYVMIYEKEF